MCAVSPGHAPHAREAAVLTVEQLSVHMGEEFEPYGVPLLRELVALYADKDKKVADAEMLERGGAGGADARTDATGAAAAVLRLLRARHGLHACREQRAHLAVRRPASPSSAVVVAEGALSGARRACAPPTDATPRAASFPREAILSTRVNRRATTMRARATSAATIARHARR